MEYVLLLAIVVGVSLQSVMQKAFNLKVSGGVIVFSAASAAASMLVFVISSLGRFDFNTDIMVYALLFAIAFSSSIISCVMAIKTGPLSISSLILSYSLIIPAFYGIAFLGEPVKTSVIAGVLLLLISLVLVNLKNGSECEKMSVKWAVYVIICFLGNGGCSTIQKVQQINHNGQYKNELMIIALAITVVILFIFAFLFERDKIITTIKKGARYYLISGISCGLVNLFVLILSNRLPASVMFPVISAGGIVLTALVSVFVYKEHLSLRQKIGFLFGIAAIILLNI